MAIVVWFGVKVMPTSFKTVWFTIGLDLKFQNLTDLASHLLWWKVCRQWRQSRKLASHLKPCEIANNMLEEKLVLSHTSFLYSQTQTFHSVWKTANQLSVILSQDWCCPNFTKVCQAWSWLESNITKHVLCIAAMHYMDLTKTYHGLEYHESSIKPLGACLILDTPEGGLFQKFDEKDI